jgi:hypothetical protein
LLASHSHYCFRAAAAISTPIDARHFSVFLTSMLREPPPNSSPFSRFLDADFHARVTPCTPPISLSPVRSFRRHFRRHAFSLIISAPLFAAERLS